MGEEIAAERAQLYPDDWDLPIEDLPVDVLTVRIDEIEVGIVTLGGRRRPRSDHESEGVEYDLLPDAAERLAELLVAAAKQARQSRDMEEEEEEDEDDWATHRTLDDDGITKAVDGRCNECGEVGLLPFGPSPGDSVLCGLCQRCGDNWVLAEHPLEERLYKNYPAWDGYGLGAILPCGHAKGGDCDPACDAIDEASATSFVQWLRTQTDRVDPVGEFASHQAADACWPRSHVSLADGLEHLKLQHAAAPAAYRAFDRAWREWFWGTYEGPRPSWGNHDLR